MGGLARSTLQAGRQQGLGSCTAALPARQANSRLVTSLQAPKRKAADASTPSTQPGWADEEAHRDACIAACEAALHLQLPAGAGEKEHGAQQAAADRQGGSKLWPARLLIFNLFALEVGGRQVCQPAGACLFALARAVSRCGAQPESA